MDHRYTKYRTGPVSERAPSGEIPSDELSGSVRAELRRRDAREIGHVAGVSAETVRRIAAGERVMRASLAAVRASLDPKVAR